jgi:Family of unknown function (DUF6319)
MSNICSTGLAASPTDSGDIQEENNAPMTVNTLTAEAPRANADTPDVWVPSAESTSPGNTPAPDAPEAEASADMQPQKAPVKKATSKKTKTLELILTVTGTADGEWRAELKQGTTYLVRNLAVAATAVSGAAKELHEDLSNPIDEVIEEARSQQAAKVAALEAELDAARKVLADLD